MALRTPSWSRRATASRLVVVLRGSPELAVRLLPAGTRPLLVAGQAVLLVCHAREPRDRYRLTAGADHLSTLLAAELAPEEPSGAGGELGRPCAWVLQRATSSWIEARWSERRGRRAAHRSSFELAQGPFSVELRVQREGREELYLRAEPAPRTDSRLFRGPRELEDLLERCGELRGGGYAPEPLVLHELRAPFLDGSPWAGFERDSAFRFVSRRLLPAHARAARRLRAVIEAQPAQLLPTP